MYCRSLDCSTANTPTPLSPDEQPDNRSCQRSGGDEAPALWMTYPTCAAHSMRVPGGQRGAESDRYALGGAAPPLPSDGGRHIGRPQRGAAGDRCLSSVRINDRRPRNGLRSRGHFAFSARNHFRSAYGACRPGRGQTVDDGAALLTWRWRISVLCSSEESFCFGEILARRGATSTSVVRAKYAFRTETSAK